MKWHTLRWNATDRKRPCIIKLGWRVKRSKCWLSPWFGLSNLMPVQHQCAWLWGDHVDVLISNVISYWMCWLPYTQHMGQQSGMSENRCLSGIVATWRTYQSLNLSLTLEDCENLSIVHAPPTSGCFFNSCYVISGQGEVWAMLLFLTRYFWSAVLWYQSFPSLLILVRFSLRKHMFIFLKKHKE